MSTFDYSLALWLNSAAGRNRILDWIAVFCAVYLTYIFAFVAVASWFGTSQGISRFQAHKAVVLAFISFVISRGILVPIIRLFWVRQRPFLATSGIVELIKKGNEASFPSGHASAMFAIAMAIYFYNKRLGWWLFAMAIVTGISRVVVGVHYPTDILGGAALGIAVAAIVQRLLAPRIDGVVSKLSEWSARLFKA